MQFPPTQASSQRQTVSSSRMLASPLRSDQRLLEIPSSCRRITGNNPWLYYYMKLSLMISYSFIPNYTYLNYK